MSTTSIPDSGPSKCYLKTEDKKGDKKGDKKCVSDTVKERLHEVFTYGCPHTAISNNFVNPRTLLIELLNKSDSKVNLIVYRDICHFLPGDKQYIDGIHFLKLLEQSLIKTTNGFYLIYLYSNLDLELPVEIPTEPNETNDKIEIEAVKIKSLMLDALHQAYLQTSLSLKARLICRNYDNIGKLSFNNMCLKLQAASDDVLELPILSTIEKCKKVLSSLLRYDRLKLCRQQLPPWLQEIVVRRMVLLYKNAPLYWKNVISNKYLQVFTQSKFEDVLTVKTKQHLAFLFPKAFDKSWLRMSNLAQKIAEFPEVERAYLLGFPLHQRMPCFKEMENAIIALSELGRLKYCQQHRDNNDKYYRQFVKMYFNKQADLVNPTDLYSQDDVLDFPSFDMIPLFTDDKHMHLIGRSSFNHILKKKVNPWNNNQINELELNNISNRLQLANKYSLPSSDTLGNLLQSVTLDQLKPSLQRCYNCGKFHSDDVHGTTRIKSSRRNGERGGERRSRSTRRGEGSGRSEARGDGSGGRRGERRRSHGSSRLLGRTNAVYDGPIHYQLTTVLSDTTFDEEGSPSSDTPNTPSDLIGDSADSNNDETIEIDSDTDIYLLDDDDELYIEISSDNN